MTAAVSYGYGTQKEIDSSEPDIIFDSFSVKVHGNGH